LVAFYEGFRVERERALVRIGDHFSCDIHFRDPFRETVGMHAFRQLFVRMFRRYREVGFSGFRIDGGGDAFTLTYDMHLRMVVGPMFVTPMASVCRSRDGKVWDLLDYYDFSSGLASPFPALASVYRRATRALFL
jgi:hypothetical protein